MKLPRFLPKQRKSRVFVRRVVGGSMLPTLRPGKIVIAHSFYRHIKPGDVVICSHDGLEKIKRVAHIENNGVYLLGDNPAASTDSRTFGQVPLSAVKAKVLFLRRRG